MKTNFYLLLFILLTTSGLRAGDDGVYSTIYLYRPTYGGLYSMYNNVSYQAKVGNQDIFSVSTDGSSFKLYSTGRMNIAAAYGGISRELNINIESGKSYYVKIDIKNKSFLVLENEELAKGLLDTSKVIPHEEDIRNPINNTALENANKSDKAQGTCFLISSAGYLVTNNHCIKNAKEITVKGVDGDFTTKYGVTVIATDASNDLALLKFGNKNLKFDNPPTAIRSSGVAQAEKVYALGFPNATAMGAEVKITEGIISARSGVQGDISKFQISAAVNPGNSGGPLIDEQGNLIGVIYAKSTVAESAGYAIKAGYLETFLKNIENFDVPNLTNTIKDKSLSEKTAAWKNYIFIVETN
ncbi:MAG: trypsin-like peptidase domain-containing protein [Bacteroidetes bacterium]|nr:trypsin-like peptidase domain-containing protein [Bacteroidota bacterium]